MSEKYYGEIKRVTLSGTGFEEISFEKPAERYLIKNFTEGDIYVSSKADATTDDSCKVPKGYGQVFEVPVMETGSVAYHAIKGAGRFVPDSITKLYLKGTGEVEVQQLCFH